MNSVQGQEHRIGVIGAGSWGTALAHLLAGKEFRLDLWAYEEEVVSQIRDQRENAVFLPGIPLSENIVPSNDIEAVARDKDLLLIVVPSHVMRPTAERIARLITPDVIVVTASKGIETGSLLTMHQVLMQTFPDLPANRFVVLSGPSFAREVAQKEPTVVTVACPDMAVAKQVQHIFATPYFRVYTHDDVIGVELGGAIKNVIAIASGIIDGMGLGTNTRAALITRGLAEIRRLGLKMGADPHTFTGLAGVGDLILTCTGSLSRNYSLGRKIGTGQTLTDILAHMRMVAEGVKNAQMVHDLAHKMGVEMPISQAVYRILYEGLSPKKALYQLMTRDLKRELADLKPSKR